ncbi:mitochondrial import inner membrane translocase subunit Tim23-like [Ptychodera flava]|uniref:mitochondrial import inner membrane translocase subunit Tim23-like n=1 Tax=Ptychodera flava TaxID=63121 RepID=UPI00396A1A30
MDNQTYGASGLFGSYSSGDPSLSVPVTAGANTFSPYLNIDPRFINEGSEFILPEGQKHKRGRFELAFSHIGGSVMLGALYGSLNGVRVGLRTTSDLTGKVRMSQMLNIITKQGASSANTVGVIALMYSIFGFSLEKVRSTEDEVNTVGAATMTGMLYGSAGGLQRVAKGGAIGLVLSSAWCLYSHRDKVRSLFGGHTM